MSDALESDRKVRILNILDDFNREALWIDPGFSYPAEHVIRAFEIVGSERGLPEVVRVDNGPKFLSNVFKGYGASHGIEIQYIQPGKPTQNAFIERFNRLLREDILDAYLFSSIS